MAIPPIPQQNAPITDKQGMLSKEWRHWFQLVAAEIALKVSGPSVAVNGNKAVFDGTTGKVIKDGGP